MDVMRSAHPPLDQFGFFPRITTRDGREIEQAMAGATLLDDGARLDGAIIEVALDDDRLNGLSGARPSASHGIQP